MNFTDDVITELQRCMGKMNAYLDSYPKARDLAGNPAHAAAARSTLDLTEALARWRAAPCELLSEPK